MLALVSTVHLYGYGDMLNKNLSVLRPRFLGSYVRERASRDECAHRTSPSIAFSPLKRMSKEILGNYCLRSARRDKVKREI